MNCTSFAIANYGENHGIQVKSKILSEFALVINQNKIIIIKIQWTPVICYFELKWNSMITQKINVYN